MEASGFGILGAVSGFDSPVIGGVAKEVDEGGFSLGDGLCLGVSKILTGGILKNVFAFISFGFPFKLDWLEVVSVVAIVLALISSREDVWAKVTFFGLVGWADLVEFLTCDPLLFCSGVHVIAVTLNLWVKDRDFFAFVILLKGDSVACSL